MNYSDSFYWGIETIDVEEHQFIVFVDSSYFILVVVVVVAVCVCVCVCVCVHVLTCALLVWDYLFLVFS